MEIINKPGNPGISPSGDLFKDIRENKANPRVKLAVAKGLIPLDPKVLGEALLILAKDTAQEVNTAAKKSLTNLPESILYYIAEHQEMDSSLLDTMSQIFSGDPEILQRLALNRATSDLTINFIATLNIERVLDIISVNQARIINFPQILSSLLKNPNLSNSTRIRLQIYKKELIEQGVLEPVGDEVHKAFRSAVKTAERQVYKEKGFEDLDEEEVEEEFEEEETEEAEEEEEEEEYEEELEQEEYEEGLEEVEETKDSHISTAMRISRLTVAEKLVLARHANKEERSILIRDSNKQVSMSVLKSPKITDGEAEMIARMRNVPDEILREIANNRDWVKNYSVIVALINNPKTPVGVSLNFVNRLQNKDLRELSTNRNVSETIRTASKRMLTARQRQSGPGKKH